LLSNFQQLDYLTRAIIEGRHTELYQCWIVEKKKGTNTCCLSKSNKTNPTMGWIRNAWPKMAVN